VTTEILRLGAYGVCTRDDQILLPVGGLVRY